ncbi:beta-ketoacyl-[acyl-carrier-protein] synthase family protein [Nocardioides bruguierae]|uniref:beta-ketoacyl-[acyl-carrier-protein] synthase family protein n=1 Tax=Nocardioides bruguierae TaxID=2945102 RepID=UPI0020220CE5|nr:beta-ketoacyl-ACP synthase II [Nocardioides bruguierae]MCL8026281.1 beta-ketoacyl-ACP synthase II [Nocardioides bruguierae]
MSKRVVVTGLGTTNPLGGDVASTWEAMLAGESGISPLTEDWAADLPVKIAGRAKVDPSEVLERVKARRLDRSSQFALIAATEAWADSGIGEGDVDPERLGVAFASGIGGVNTLLGNYDQLLAKGPRRVSPLAVPMLMPNAPAATVSLHLGARAFASTPVSACASGNEAIALGLDQIRLGRADVVVCGGTEAAIHPLNISAFANMMALSKSGTANDTDPTAVSRPWDTGRDGFVLGEGAGCIVIESEEHAKARGARIYATVLGAAVTADAHDIAQPDPEGRGGTRAIRRALAEGDVDPASVVHVNAHATSTPQGDIAEGLMLHAVLGSEHAREVVVTSTKSMTGHLLGGAGALEAVAVVKAVVERVSPPTINLDEQDPAVDLDIATKPRDLPAGDIVALNNSFGFGGANVAVAFGSI